MKSGMCTVQFNAFLQSKRATQSLRGGNSEEFYDKEGTKNKSQMLVDMHPDVSKMCYKWNRWHHYVNYKSFEVNKPKCNGKRTNRERISCYLDLWVPDHITY